MSRLQNVLDKAERDGAALRIREIAGTAEPAMFQGTAIEAPRPPRGPAGLDPSVGAATNNESRASSATPVDTPTPPIRVIRGVALDRHLVTATSIARGVNEQYHALRTRITHADPTARASLLLVTSARPGDGKSLTAGNLGLSMAREPHRRVCVVDANLRDPQVHRLFGTPDGPGLCDILVGQATLEEALCNLEEHRLTVLSAGRVPAHPAELLGTTSMRRTLEQLRSMFDRVVIDAPAAIPLADVGILSPMVDKVLFVVRVGITPKPAIHEAISTLDPSKMLGLILNDAA
jgi:capsular exopolysaccharide synthesis family protein